MGTFYSEVISNEQKEIDFLTAVYNRIMGTQQNPSFLWSGITCSVTPEDGETIDNADPSDMVYEQDKYCNMDFVLDSTNNIILRLQVKPTFYWYLRCSCYNLTLYVNGTPIFDKKEGSATKNYLSDGVCYAPASAGRDGQAITFDSHRELTFSKYVDSNLYAFWVSPSSGPIGHGSTFKDAGVSFVKFKDSNGTWHWVGYEGPSAIQDGVAYDIDGTNPVKMSSTFSYEAKTGYLDFISHSNFTSNTIKKYASPYIYNCTTVDFGDTLSIKNGANFLAIGSNSMVILN